MTYEIIKISPSEHHIVKTETQEVVSVYTRMSSAKRGLERLLAKEQVAELEVAAVEIAESCEERVAALGAAQARIRNKTAAVILHYLLKYDFANVNKFMAFAGLNPQIGQSGESVKHKEKMTRYGHRKLKSAFYMPAVAAFKSETFAPFVQRLLKKGKPKKLVIGALMRKLAKIAYCVYKSNKPFNPAEYVKIKYDYNQ